MRSSIALLLLAAMPPALSIVEGAAAQLVETIEVRVTNVDVVVTDRAGKPVTGLTKDDFEIFENRKPQEITNFYEVREAIAADPAIAAEIPAEVRRRRVVVFVDQESVDVRRRMDAFASARRSLEKLLQPEDEVMVVSFYRERRILTGLTNDRPTIDRAMQDAATQAVGSGVRQFARDDVMMMAREQLAIARESQPRPGAVGLRRSGLTFEDAYKNSISTARAYADELFAAQKRLVDAIEQTVRALAGMEGRKALIFIGGDLQQRPGIDVFDAIDALYRPTGMFVVSSANGEAVKRSLGGELNRLGRTANANGVALYLVDASDVSSRRSAAAAGHVDAPETMDVTDITETGLNLETATSMTSLAATTGGRALVASINYDRAFEFVVRDLASYYSLGYKPAPGDGERRLLVRVKKPGLTVRSKRSYRLKTTEEETNDRVIANAFNPRVTSEMPITLQLGQPTRDGDAFRVPFKVRFPGDITTIPDGDKLAGEFAIYLVTASPAGNLSPVARDIRPFQYPAAQAETIRARPITYTGSLRVRSGEQLVSVAVVDRVGGKAGFARTKFVAP